MKHLKGLKNQAGILSAGLGAIAGGIGGSLISGIFSSKSASRQRGFQEIMSRTAHQREAADLEAAGLNRILSVTGGPGASTPGGAKADTPNFSALALVKAQTEKLNAETENVRKRTNIMVPVEDVMTGLGAITTPLADEFQQIVKKLPDISSATEQRRLINEVETLLKNKPSDVTGIKEYNKIQKWWFKYRHRNLPPVH